MENNVEKEKEKEAARGVSIRLDSVNIAKFRDFAAAMGSQNEAMTSLLELVALKEHTLLLPEREKEIQCFESTVSSLVRMYAASLDINSRAEKTLEERFAKEFKSKDAIISDLQSKIVEFKEQLKSLKELEKQNASIYAEAEKLKVEIVKKEKTLEQQASNVESLSTIVTQYKGYKDLNAELEAQNKELNAFAKAEQVTNKELVNKIALLQTAATEKENFYEVQIASINAENKSLIAELKAENKNAIAELKTENKEKLAELKAENKSVVMELKEELKSAKNLENTYVKNLANFENEIARIKEQLETTIAESSSNAEKVAKLKAENKKLKAEKVEKVIL